jgi:hypothetical protein
MADVTGHPTPNIAYAVSTWAPGKKITTREELFLFLQCALEVELTTIPPYMLAMYSMHPGVNEEAFFTIRGVVLEEMLHMSLVANIMNAVGCEPQLTAPYGDTRIPANVPVYPCVLPFTPTAERPIALRPFSPAAMETFIAIEGPDEPRETPKSGWRSIGHFYLVLKQGLKDLARLDAREPDQELRLFPSDPEVRERRARRQICPEHFYNSGGEVIRVTDLAGALEAMDVVVEQGEGLHHTIFTSDDVRFGEQRQVSHFFRFMEIYYGHRFSPYDLPHQLPTGEPVDVDWSAAYAVEVVDTDDKRDRVQPYPGDLRLKSEAFNLAYTRLLAQCHWAFNGFPSLLDQAVPTMLELRYLAEEIFRNPLPGQRRRHAFPTFEVDFDELQRQKESVLKEAESMAAQQEAEGKAQGALEERMAKR